MKQKFIKEVKGHFNLRKPKGDKPTDVFFVVRLDGKQYKFSSGMKVYPDQWDSKGQQAIESNTLSKLDNRNNKMLNAKINRIRCYYVDFLKYLCRTEENIPDKGELLRTYIYQEMERSKKNKTDFDAERIICEAFEYYYKYTRQVKSSSLRQYEATLKQFTDYLQEKGLVNDKHVFSQSGLNDFKK